MATTDRVKELRNVAKYRTNAEDAIGTLFHLLRSPHPDVALEARRAVESIARSANDLLDYIRLTAK